MCLLYVYIITFQSDLFLCLFYIPEEEKNDGATIPASDEEKVAETDVSLKS